MYDYFKQIKKHFVLTKSQNKVFSIKMFVYYLRINFLPFWMKIPF